MITGLTAAVCLLLCVCIGLIVVCLNLQSKCRRFQDDLARYREITDLEKHASDQVAHAEAAKAQTARAHTAATQLQATSESLRAEIETQQSQIAVQRKDLAAAAAALGNFRTLDELNKQIEKQKQLSAQYNKLLGNFKTAEELTTHISQQKNQIQSLNQTMGKFQSLTELDRQLATQKAQVGVLESRVRELHDVLGGVDNATALHTRLKNQESRLAQLQAQAEQVEEALEMQEFGFYRARYGFDSSSRYQEMIDQVREQQSAMVKGDTAVHWAKTWTVEGSAQQGQRMMKERTKLILRAFNGECDAAIAKVKYNNATTLEARINRSCEQINRLGKTNSSSITDAFLQLKRQELHLVHEHRVKQQQEKEEQQRLRDQMREEEKAQREIEEEEQKAAKEEEVAERALEKARRTFEEATQGQREVTEQAKAQNALLAAQVAKLENELQDAIDRKAKAIARAQLTRSGYVYILSNVGSFGDNIYKLGLTRRLDPLDRVKELGDASVPFPFDVHAVVYSENAPELEHKLHRHFANRRVNLVTLRREYFRVTLEEVIVAVKEYFGEVTFVKFPEAAEYRETVAKRKSDTVPRPMPSPAPLQLA